MAFSCSTIGLLVFALICDIQSRRLSQDSSDGSFESEIIEQQLLEGLPEQSSTLASLLLASPPASTLRLRTPRAGQIAHSSSVPLLRTPLMMKQRAEEEPRLHTPRERGDKSRSIEVRDSDSRWKQLWRRLRNRPRVRSFGERMTQNRFFKFGKRMTQNRYFKLLRALALGSGGVLLPGGSAVAATAVRITRSEAARLAAESAARKKLQEKMGQIYGGVAVVGIMLFSWWATGREDRLEKWRIAQAEKALEEERRDMLEEEGEEDDDYD